MENDECEPGFVVIENLIERRRLDVYGLLRHRRALRTGPVRAPGRGDQREDRRPRPLPRFGSLQSPGAPSPVHGNRRTGPPLRPRAITGAAAVVGRDRRLADARAPASLDSTAA